MPEKEQQTIGAEDVGTLEPQLTPDGQPVKSREEVLAELEANDNRVPVNLYRGGVLHRTIHLPAENATKYIDFLGEKFTRAEDNNWYADETQQPAE